MWQTRPLRRQSRNRHVSASGRHTPGPPLPRARPRATPSSSEAPQPCRRGAPRPLSRLDGGAPAAVVERGVGGGCREIPLTRGKRSDAGAAPANITVKDVPPQVRFCKRQVQGTLHTWLQTPPAVASQRCRPRLSAAATWGQRSFPHRSRSWGEGAVDKPT